MDYFNYVAWFFWLITQEKFGTDLCNVGNQSLQLKYLRAELEGIKVKGKNVPKPIRNWPQCGVRYFL